jgi:hypothetical protein
MSSTNLSVPLSSKGQDAANSITTTPTTGVNAIDRAQDVQPETQDHHDIHVKELDPLVRNSVSFSSCPMVDTSLPQDYERLPVDLHSNAVPFLLLCRS